VFYFVDGGSFIKIYDKRDRQNIRIVVLNELERAVFLACVDVVSLQQLQEMFANVPEFELIAMLQSFEQNELVFVEDEHYICLQLRFSVIKRAIMRMERQVNVSVRSAFS
jgi:ABC-type antimicrobial peptide transport system permease subunit